MRGRSVSRTAWAVACAAAMFTLSPAAAVGNPAAPASLAISAQRAAVTEPQAAASSNFTSTVASAAGAGYRIGAEDVLQVSVWDNKELTLSVVVRPDGYISLPLIQDVQAEGLTAPELAALIRSKLLQFIKEPQVSVIVTQVNSPKVYVIGNVARPGVYPLRGELSVLQVLSMAGGFTEFASPRGIRIVRGSSAGQEIRKINYNRMIEDGGQGNYLLAPGDTIVVP